jgi:hypothetical protein
MMEVETLDARNIVVLHPGRAVAIRPGDKKPAQRGDEDNALDREFECTELQQPVEHGCDAEPVPDSAEQQRSADALGRNRQRSVGVLVERADEQHLVSELGPGSQQRGESAGGDQIVGAPQISDDGLPYSAVDAVVLDHLNVGAWAGFLDAEEHGAPKTEHHEN